MNPKWLTATVLLYQALSLDAATEGAALEGVRIDLGYDGTLADENEPLRVNVLRASSRGQTGNVVNCATQKHSTRIVLELQAYDRDSRESGYSALAKLADDCQQISSGWLKENFKNVSVSWDFENDGDASAGAYLAWLTANINEL